MYAQYDCNQRTRVTKMARHTHQGAEMYSNQKSSWCSMIDSVQRTRETTGRLCCCFVPLHHFKYIQTAYEQKEYTQASTTNAADLHSLHILLTHSCMVSELRIIRDQCRYTSDEDEDEDEDEAEDEGKNENEYKDKDDAATHIVDITRVTILGNDIQDLQTPEKTHAVIEGPNGLPSTWSGEYRHIEAALASIRECSQQDTSIYSVRRVIENALDVWCGRQVRNKQWQPKMYTHSTYEVSSFLVGPDNGVVFSMFVQQLRCMSSVQRVQNTKLLVLLLGIALQLGSQYNAELCRNPDKVLRRPINAIPCIHPCWSLVHEFLPLVYEAEQFSAVCMHLYHTSMWAYKQWELQQ
jgi:hypothetical protein